MGLWPNPPTPGGIVQTASTVLGSATTTTSTSYVDLITVPITTGGSSRLEIYASVSTSNAVSRASTNQDYFRLVIDSTQLIEGGSEQWTVTESGALFAVTDVLAAGAHTVRLQWHTDTGGTLRCNAGAAPPEHASLVVVETTH